jgi:nanoRNase/pAp phosphatase (c-di-AMP/oligoRNAs hydrolase)
VGKQEKNNMEQSSMKRNGDPAKGTQPAPEGEKNHALRQILENHKNERHIIVLQDFPDPDAIASAFAHQLISEKFDIEVDIVYAGKISHQQNLALVRMLGIEMHAFHDGLDLTKYDGAVFVDNQGTTSGEIVKALEAENIPTLIVVDHHENQNRLVPEFSDIRRTYGAASTIFTEYLESGDLIELEKSRREHVWVATALFHGILTDTDRFIRATAEDFQAAAFLSRYRDADILDQIMSQARSKRTMDVIQNALKERVIAENFSIAGIGYLRAEDRDAIPQAADFLLTEENVHTAVVFGIVTGIDHNERVIGSMRTTKITLDPDEFIKDVFGKDAIGQYFGGGKMSAGGFEIPLGFLSGGQAEEFNEIKWQVYDQQVKQKLLDKIGVSESLKDTPRPTQSN